MYEKNVVEVKATASAWTIDNEGNHVIVAECGNCHKTFSIKNQELVIKRVTKVVNRITYRCPYCGVLNYI